MADNTHLTGECGKLAEHLWLDDVGSHRKEIARRSEILPAIPDVPPHEAYVSVIPESAAQEHPLRPLLEKNIEFLQKRTVDPINEYLGLRTPANYTKHLTTRNIAECVRNLENAQDPAAAFLNSLAFIFSERPAGWRASALPREFSDDFRRKLCAAFNEMAQHILIELNAHFEGERHTCLSGMSGMRFLDQFLGIALRTRIGLVFCAVFGENESRFHFSLVPEHTDIQQLTLRLARSEKLAAESLQREEQLSQQASALREQLADCLETLSVLRARTNFSIKTTITREWKDLDIFEGIPKYPGGRGNSPFQHLRQYYGRWLTAFGAEENQISRDMVKFYDQKLVRSAEQKVAQDKKRKGLCFIDLGGEAPVPIEYLSEILPSVPSEKRAPLPEPRAAAATRQAQPPRQKLSAA